MDKKQAVQLLMNLINSLKLTKQEYDSCTTAVQTLMQEVPLAVQDSLAKSAKVLKEASM